MNQETFEQVPIAKENVTGGQYMKEGDVVEVMQGKNHPNYDRIML